MEKEFTAQDMIKFANWFAGDIEISDIELRSYRNELKRIEEEEYQLYLKLKLKYENTNS